MRAILKLSARLLLVFFHGRGSGLIVVLLLLAVSLGGGIVLAGDASAVEARQYSAYSDPEKPALSLVLSEEQNVEELQEKFDLSDEEVDTVLAAVRKENEALSRTQGESRRIIESNKGQAGGAGQGGVAQIIDSDQKLQTLHKNYKE